MAIKLAGEGQRHVLPIAMEGRREDERPTRPQEAPSLRHQFTRRIEVLQHLKGIDHVILAVVGREVIID